jgi:type II secretory pathway pseudopilin PulG
MRERGHTLLEILVALALILAMLAVGLPLFRAYLVEARLLGAGRIFKGEFLKARWGAIRSGKQTAIRFERGPDGFDYYSLYMDGNHNGVLAEDITRGKDPRIGGPFRLDGGLTGVRVGINPGTPAIPPDTGLLDTTDPIRFGRSNMVSFSPLGTASPGTFYLAGEWIQAAVRVTPGGARVRLMITRGGRWTER